MGYNIKAKTSWKPKVEVIKQVLSLDCNKKKKRNYDLNYVATVIILTKSYI